jgi:hypothetical protein
MAKPPTPSKASFDSLAEKRSLNFNTTGEVDSFENVINNPVRKYLGRYQFWEKASKVFFSYPLTHPLKRSLNFNTTEVNSFENVVNNPVRKLGTQKTIVFKEVLNPGKKQGFLIITPSPSTMHPLKGSQL